MLFLARQLRKNMTDAELFLWKKIRRKSLGYRFIRQYIVDDLYIVDFYCQEKRLVIELDGGQHADNTEDVKRQKYLEEKGIIVLRFWNDEILTNIEGCLYIISEFLKK